MWTTFEGRVVFYTARAVAFEGHFWEGHMFFPISQVEIVPDGDETVVMRVKDWLANKRGILEFTHYNKEDIERMAAS